MINKSYYIYFTGNRAWSWWTYVCASAIRYPGIGSPSDLLVTREPTGPLTLEEEDGFCQGIAVIMSPMNTNNQEQEQAESKGRCHGHCLENGYVGWTDSPIIYIGKNKRISRTPLRKIRLSWSRKWKLIKMGMYKWSSLIYCVEFMCVVCTRPLLKKRPTQ